MDKQNAIITDINTSSPSSPKLGADTTDTNGEASTTVVAPTAAPRTPTPAPIPEIKLKVEKKLARSKEKIYKGLNHETAEYLIDNVSMLLTSGVTIGEALDSITPELPQKKLQKEVQIIRKKIDEGIPFSKAIEESGLFNVGVITLIEVGESSGKLADNLKVIARQMHKSNLMNEKVRSALLYPTFLISLLIAVGTAVGIFLLPRLLTLINGLHVNVNLFTRILIRMGTFFGRWGFLIFGLVFGLIFCTWVATKLSTAARAFVESILFKIPGIRKLLIQTEIARFGFILGTQLDAGLPVETALASLSGSMSTHRYRQFTKSLQTRFINGVPVSKIFIEPRSRRLLGGTVCQIIISAEHSGNLAVSLLKIGENYEEKADITAKNLEILIEPIILVVIAVGVLLIALAVFLPIYSLVGNFGGAK